MAKVYNVVNDFTATGIRFKTDDKLTIEEVSYNKINLLLFYVENNIVEVLHSSNVASKDIQKILDNTVLMEDENE